MQKYLPQGRYRFVKSGAERDRTADLMNAIHALSQLSYCPNLTGKDTRDTLWCQEKRSARNTRISVVCGTVFPTPNPVPRLPEKIHLTVFCLHDPPTGLHFQPFAHRSRHVR